ncbi:class I SAM-dependent methyltransferase [Spirosoma flavum]|uniref:Class I SAM-dependent methyltransferase n=1 Tax=Spirosoma flavum TaxID=2048557 RepID=A0ABW6ALB4_9BACT
MSQAKQTAQKVDYNGSDNLAMMSFAKNYNGSLYEWVKQGTTASTLILDFGAGNGEYANRFPANAVDTVEIDPELLPLIKQPVYTDLSQLSHQYDMVYTINVLEHIEYHQAIVNDLFNKIKPGGTIKVFVPARMEIFSRMDEHVGHYRRYDKRMVSELLKSSGFQVTDCRYYDFAGYFISLLYKWLGKDGRITKDSVIFYDRIIFPISRVFDQLTSGKIIGKNVLAEAIRPR